MNDLTFQEITDMSVAFAKSGLFGYKTSSEAFSLMMIAKAHGINPALAAERYHIIQGRPAMKSDAMLAAFQESGGKVKWVKRTDTECILHLEHEKGGELDVKWDKARATASGLWGKSNWKTYPTQMLAARCVSEGVRALYPACLCGMYTPEEVQDFKSEKEDKSETVPEFVDATVENTSAQEQDEAVEAEVVQPDYNTATAPLFTPGQPAQAPVPKKTQAENDANYQKICMELRDRNPEVFDTFLKNHALKGVMDIKSSAGRKKFIDEVTATINAATEPEV